MTLHAALLIDIKKSGRGAWIEGVSPFPRKSFFYIPSTIRKSRSTAPFIAASAFLIADRVVCCLGLC